MSVAHHQIEKQEHPVLNWYTAKGDVNGFMCIMCAADHFLEGCKNVKLEPVTKHEEPHVKTCVICNKEVSYLDFIDPADGLSYHFD